MYVMLRLLLIGLCFASFSSPCLAQGTSSIDTLTNHARTSRIRGATGNADDLIVLDTIEPTTVTRGESVTISGQFPLHTNKIVVQLTQIDGAAQPLPPQDNASSANELSQHRSLESVTVVEPGKSFRFTIPRDMPLGAYDITVTFVENDKPGVPIQVPTPDGLFRIVTKDPVKISAVYPAVTYIDQGAFEFTIVGEGFSSLPQDNALFIEGRGIVPVCSPKQIADDCVQEAVSDSGRELRFFGISPAKYYGPMKVRMRVGDIYSEQTIGITLSPLDKQKPALFAVGLLVVIILMIVVLLWSETRRTRGRFKFLNALLLDKETNTYSLSKFQFFLWTAAALFGYIYLTIARSLVQGNLSFAEIPENLPGILLITGTTTAVAIGITSAKGAKGAGDPHPSLADFITTGGVVAAERVQFFVWTIVGVCAFIMLTLSIEPGRIETLPAIPQGFLYLMGVSSAGYLGGKLARQPGPVITQIEALQGSLTLLINGSYLSPDATLKIDDTDITLSMVDKVKHPQGRPEIVVRDDTPGFAKSLQLLIATPDQKWTTGSHDLRLTNPDGQSAGMTFTVTRSSTTSEAVQPDAPSASASTADAESAPSS